MGRGELIIYFFFFFKWTNTDLSTPGFTQHLLMLGRRVTLAERPGGSEKGKREDTLKQV